MAKRPFCYLCGRGTEELYEGLCRSCALDSGDVARLPVKLHARICRGCLSIYCRGWEHGGQDIEELIEGAVERLVLDNLSHELEDLEVEVAEGALERRGRAIVVPVTVNVKGLYKRLPYEGELETTLELKETLCPVCSRQAGGYYEALLQFRGAYEGVLHEAHALISRLHEKDRSAFISEEKPVKGGLDIKLGSKQAAKAVAAHFKNRHKAEIKTSSTLIGRKEGRDLYRTTYLIRLK